MTGTNCDLFTHKSVPVIFEPPCTKNIGNTYVIVVRASEKKPLGRSD
jgi:hypothetical protein